VSTLRILLIVLAVSACKSSPDAGASPQPTAAEVEPLVAAKPQTVQMREGGYEQARAEAQRRGLPLFIDVWASWCHTCLSMKQYVLPDPALGRLADKLVWLSLDSESASSAAFLQRFPTRNIPTLWVIDAATQEPLLKWIGTATVPELLSLLDDVLSADRGSAGEASALWVRGNRASAAAKPDEAIALYRQALESANPGWNKRPSAVETLSMRLSEAKRGSECVELAAREAAKMPKGTALVNVLVNALDAIDDLPAADPARGSIPALTQLSARVAEDPKLPVLADDRSNLFLSLVEVLKTTDPPEAQRVGGVWVSQLESEADSAPTPAARRVFDPHRVDAYLAMNTPQKAIPMLELSEREDPSDYNAPARMARAYFTLKQLEPAKAAIDRALSRCEGPRKLRLYTLKADILLAADDKKAAKETLGEALTFARSVPLNAGYESLRQKIEQRVRELS
jgi:tetratricopeptide (TPR) repeat protein